MVLDTRWKRFKYSNGSKTLCVLLALVMVAVIAVNGLSIFKAVAIFEDDILKPHEAHYKDSDSFVQNLYFDTEGLFSIAGLNAEEKRYYEAEEKYVEKALNAYKTETEKNRLTQEEVDKYIERLHNDEDIYNDYYEEYYSDYDDRYYLSAYYNIYRGDDYNWYKTDFDYHSLTTVSVASNNIAFGHTETEAENMFRDWFYRNYYESYVSNYVREYYGNLLYELKNVKFYADGGEVFTNVTENTQAFINEVKSGKGDYFYCENGEMHFSGFFEEKKFDQWAYTHQESSNVYISVDTDFGEIDRYRIISDEYESIAQYNVAGGIAVMFFAFIALIVLAVMSVRLAGHTEDGIKTAKFDGFPMDLHLVLNSALIFAAGFGIAYIFGELFYAISRYTYSGRVSLDEIQIATNGLVRIAVIALVSIIYLLILEFATSVARNVKAEKPIIKRTAIFKLFELIFKLIKLIFKLIFKHGGKGILTVLKFIFVTIIGGFFKMIGKLFRIFLHLCKSIALKPKRLEKKLVSATVLYTIFNFVSFVIIAIMYINTFDYGYFECFLIGLLWFIALIALDTYAVHRAVKYLKALDDIIDTSAKREPLPYDTATLPPSLKTLAESLEATNAELQAAVLKAVKDERTKAELITNVSHDLKTPLTSVINYIDLLQKCDIEDETAKQYMAVIDEKSARLKRLIEDLIEASKVSTGNVTLNKTKLNLCELASQAIVEETSDIEKNNLQIIFDETVGKHIVYADGTKIYRVFENLLSNARKYSAPYSRIYASVYSDDNAGYFEIKNISKDPLNISAEELTERFVRGDKSRSEEGNGLGLSIARELCKLNGGDLIITIDGDLFKATVKLPRVAEV